MGARERNASDVLLSRIRDHGLNEEAIAGTLTSESLGRASDLKLGMGLERIMMYVTGMKNIRDVIPCPRTFGSASL